MQQPGSSRQCKPGLSRLGAGTERSPAGVLYTDLVFDQPKDCQLRKANVEIVLEEVDEGVGQELPRIEKSKKRKDSKATRPTSSTELLAGVSTIPDGNSDAGRNSLQFTDFYGPRQLVGEPTEVAVKKTWHLTPEFQILGYGIGGMGYDRESNLTKVSRWTFTGQTRTSSPSPNFYGGMCVQEGPDTHYGGDGSRRIWKSSARPASSSTKDLATYRRLNWSLDEDDFQGQTRHSSLIHTAFVLQHDLKPFYIHVYIDGKLQRRSDRVKGSLHRLKTFPIGRRAEQGKSTTLVSLDKEAKLTFPLDSIARGLARSMELANMEASRVQMPDALPVSFQEVPATIGEQRPVPGGDTSSSTLLEERVNEPSMLQSREQRHIPRPPSVSAAVQHQLPSRGETPVLIEDYLHSSPKVEATVRTLPPKTHTQPASPPDSLKRRNNRALSHEIPPSRAVEINSAVQAAENLDDTELDLLAAQISHFPALLFLVQWVVYILSFLPRGRDRRPGPEPKRH
ncbi:hypothetical protein N7492_010354 [Penicillium capsulatum]|uniref:Uncharacterized protein n=1 Tax=Penicillium capsulatum TaxID=69766 RepID=A0A9W9HNC8_9EURO|nr:hypothetical protein N7492_010354 [Penicillium capsulatum]